MGTISDYLHLKVNLKEKMYLFASSTTQMIHEKKPEVENLGGTVPVPRGLFVTALQ